MVHVRERRAQIILLVRAFEEVDPQGLVLPSRERVKATRRAVLVTGLSGERGQSPGAWRHHAEEAVLRRARVLFDWLRRVHPAMPRILRVAQLGSSAAPVVCGGAFVAGVALNALDPRAEIHLFYVPLLAVLAWSLALYAALPLLVLARGSSGRGPTSWIAGWLFRRAVGRRLRAARMTEGHPAPEARAVHRAVMRFSAAWRRLAGPLLAARARRLEHGAAIALALGAMAGLWLRAYAFGQPVAWSAEWLDPPDMQTLMGAILGPAAALLGTHVPDVAPLAVPGGGDPAPWVALYAATCALFVLAPRTLLALVEGWRVRRLRATLPIDLGDAYFLRMFAAWRGARRLVEIVPIGRAPRPPTIATLRALLADHFGTQAEVRTREPIAQASSATSRLAALVRAAHELGGGFDLGLVLLFQADEPPIEAVPQLLRELPARLDPERDHLLVALDGAPDPAWSAALAGAGLTALCVERDERRPADELLDAVRAALWPVALR